MTVKDLKELLDGVPDNLKIVLPVTMEFDGAFYSPCIKESGVGGLGIEDLSEEDIAERKLLNKPIQEEDAFLLVPCGFFEPHEGVAPELN